MTGRRILVTGASGILGSALVMSWRERFDVVAATGRRRLSLNASWTGDLAEKGAAEQLSAEARADLVVHAAAWSDVDGCEADPARAKLVNAEVPGRLAAAARRSGAAFAYISTESVFDGRSGRYREGDATNPLNGYAASKLAGEREVLGANPDALVVRIGLEGWRPFGNPGFVQWVVEALRKGESLAIVTDWVHTVVFASNLAIILERLWRAGAAGIFHAGCDKPASNWEIAQAAVRVFGLDASLIRPIRSEELKLRAARPKDVSLISDKLRDAIGPSVWDLDTGLAQMRDQERNGLLAQMRAMICT